MSLADIIAAVRLFRVFAGSASPLVAAVRGPIITVMLSSMLVLAVLSVREGGVRAGVRLILENPHETNAMQRELRAVERRDEAINDLLKAELAKAPTAARVRVAVIHNGAVGLTGIGLLRFDITHALARHGYSVGTLLTNAPLSDWNLYLSHLLAGNCSIAGREAMGTAERARMEELGVSERLACPVVDIQGRLLGGLFVTWPTGVVIPRGADMADLVSFSKSIAAQIAAAMIAGGEQMRHD